MGSLFALVAPDVAMDCAIVAWRYRVHPTTDVETLLSFSATGILPTLLRL